METSSHPTAEAPADQLLDMRGTLCPIPVIETAKALRAMPPGSTLLVLGTDPGLATDMPAWCRATKNELLELRADGGLLQARIRKVAPGGSR